MLSNQVLDKDTSEDRIAELVDTIKRSPYQRDTLVELLPEQLPLYVGRSTNETIRIRGYILAAFEQVGLPEAAIPYVLEELETGRDAYLVAGAARAVRGLANPSSEFVPFLFKAIENIKYMDDALTFEQYKPRWPIANHTTALSEIFQSFEWLGSQAQSALSDLEVLYHSQDDFSTRNRRAIKIAIDAIQTGNKASHACCSGDASISNSFVTYPQDHVLKPGFVAAIEFEDQANNKLKYSEFFSRIPSIVVFFYTRCNNPNKCSLTITKLGKLQHAIREQGLEGQLKTAAITYDPEYDLPARLKAYGENRGVVFSDDHRFLRTPNGLKELQGFLNLGVNYGGATVNRHRIELFILDDQGRIAGTFARLQWDVEEVLDYAKAVLQTGTIAADATTAEVAFWQPATTDLILPLNAVASPAFEPFVVSSPVGCGCGCDTDRHE